MAKSLNLERFWARVDKSGEHWIWKGAKTKMGYGKIMLNKREIYVHRAAYALGNRMSLDELEPYRIIITCGVNSCCKPEHLVKVSKGIFLEKEP
ncbi:MAG: hypothetical protein ABI954_13900 [Pyrinomonadaceae bacterium]